MVARAGFPATIRCEPRQARKGATVAMDSSAGERLVRATAILYHHSGNSSRRLIRRVHTTRRKYAHPCQ
jgi:hypothetical protein